MGLVMAYVASHSKQEISCTESIAADISIATFVRAFNEFILLHVKVTESKALLFQSVCEADQVCQLTAESRPQHPGQQRLRHHE